LKLVSPNDFLDMSILSFPIWILLQEKSWMWEDGTACVDHNTKSLVVFQALYLFGIFCMLQLGLAV